MWHASSMTAAYGRLNQTHPFFSNVLYIRPITARRGVNTEARTVQELKARVFFVHEQRVRVLLSHLKRPSQFKVRTKRT